MTQIAFNVNGQSVTVEAEPEKPLLWVLREDLGLTGAKYGCGMASAGVARFISMATRSVPASLRWRAPKGRM